jgi:peptide/nickel transport system permease protein
VSAPTDDVALPTLAALPSTGRRRFSGIGRGGWAAVGVLALLLLFAVLGPLLVTADPTSVDLSFAFVGTTPGHPLGFDGQGRDLLSRLASGSRTALLGPLVIVAISTVLGSTIAMAAAWRGGWFDTAVARVVDAMFAFPGLLLAILAVALFGPSLFAAAIALSVSYTPYVARLVRSAALRERAMPYVAALEVQGFRGSRIVLRHLLPNLTGLIVAASTLSFGYALIDLASLSFIGLGVQPPQADWGQMVSSGVPGILQGFPQESLFAATLIVITVGAVNYLGDRLTELSEGGGA